MLLDATRVGWPASAGVLLAAAASLTSLDANRCHIVLSGEEEEEKKLSGLNETHPGTQVTKSHDESLWRMKGGKAPGGNGSR